MEEAMKKIIFITVLILQLACGLTATPEPTSTPEPSPQPTVTIAPTAEAIPTSEINFGDSGQLVTLNGFTINVPFFFLNKVDKSSILIANEDKNLSIIFFSDLYDNTDPLENLINDFLASLEKRGASFETSDPEPIMIDGVEGVAMDIQGNLSDVPVQGMAIAVSPFPDLYVFGLATSNLESDVDIWENEHKTIFMSFLDTIQFVEFTGSCTISTDNTYGYTEQNPIQVGGDFMTGPSRERAYLDNLLGPNGEELSYERQGSAQTDTTILDIYIVTGSGINETLYIDEYVYSEPQAPVGFTCKGEFPLTTP